MAGRPWSLLVVALAAGCRHTAGSAAPGACPRAGDETAFGAIDVRRGDARPNWVLVPRDGDPRAAAAAVVVTGGTSYASTALSALLEARLQKSGFPLVETRADRDSFRVRALVETPERAVEFQAAVARALASPVAAGSAELSLVSKRIASLRRHPIDAPIAAAVARCTGELGLLASEPAPDPASPDGASELDSVRNTSYASTRVAFGFVGAPSLVDAVAAAYGSSDKWPKSGSIDAAPFDDEAGVFVAQPRPAGGARVTVAVRRRRADLAVATALDVGSADGALVARLRGLSVPFRVVEAVGAARPRGGCTSVVLEPFKAPPTGIEEAAATAAAIARQEIEAGERVGVEEQRGDRALGYEGAKAVRMASDPREGAELAALWSLSAASSDEHDRAAVALALGAPADTREASDAPASQVQASAKRFSAALDRMQKAWSTPVLEHRERVEHGQGELWLLAASPCGALAEGEADAGMTALALMTALATRSRETRGVALEPWTAPDGIGVLAHGAKLPGESWLDQTVRVAEEAARALSVFPFSPAPFANARAALLGRVGDGISQEGRALNTLAGALVPGHPSWLAPLGAWDGIARAGIEGTSLRWTALTGGPIRLAVLSNEVEEQAGVAARIVDRWLVRSGQPRACPPVESTPAPKTGTLTVALASPPPLAQALVGASVPRQGSDDAIFGELTLAGLGGSDGWLAKAIASPSLAATAQARIVGGARAAALVVDVRAPEASLDSAVAQVRGLFDRLHQGAMAASDLERSVAQRERWDLEASLDPRRRLVDLWRDRGPAKPSAPSLDAWRAWAAGALRDDKLVVVLAKPRH